LPFLLESALRRRIAEMEEKDPDEGVPDLGESPTPFARDSPEE
jgi:hypothetical protein